MRSLTGMKHHFLDLPVWLHLHLLLVGLGPGVLRIQLGPEGEPAGLVPADGGGLGVAHRDTLKHRATVLNTEAQAESHGSKGGCSTQGRSVEEHVCELKQRYGVKQRYKLKPRTKTADGHSQVTKNTGGHSWDTHK